MPAVLPSYCCWLQMGSWIPAVNSQDKVWAAEKQWFSILSVCPSAATLVILASHNQNGPKKVFKGVWILSAWGGIQKKCPQATSPGHKHLAVIFAQQLPAAASTKRQPDTGTGKPARLCSWEWIWYCLGQKLPGLARGFFLLWRHLSPS